MRRWVCVAGCVAALVGCVLPAGGTVYVVVGGVGAGSSWANALGSVQAGINAAFGAGGDEVWVARGTYTELLTLRNNVQVYGGFVGTEANLADRPAFPRPVPDPNASVVDGFAGGSVVTAGSGVTASARIDGFTLTNGKSDYGGGGILCASSSPVIINNTITANEGTRGAGIYCVSASPAITSNVITLNHADDYGGGICCENSSSPTITGNTITDNTAFYYGGGVDAEFNSSPTISGNTIEDNVAGWDGGGVFCFSGCSSGITRNTIEGNSAGWYGAGIYCYQSSPTILFNFITANAASLAGGGIYADYQSSAGITNNVIDQNTAGFHGGGVFCRQSSPVMTNNTIVSNTAARHGGGLECSVGSSPPVSNNIIAFNSSGIYAYLSTPTLRNNCVYNTPGQDYTGLAPGVGDISTDPLLVNLAGGDYHLTAGSPCRNTGWMGAPAIPATDMDGNPRTMGGQIDMGAYEFIEAGAFPTCPLPEAKAMPEQSPVRIEGAVVTASFDGFFYIENASRCCGMRVKRSGQPSTPGALVDVSGMILTSADGERYIDASSVKRVGGGPVRPLAMKNAALGGCTGVAGQRGVIGGAGPNNIGVLVRTWGRVIESCAYKGWFKIDDGSVNRRSLSRPPKVVPPAGAAVPPAGSFVIVTGICSCEQSATGLTPVILAVD